MIMVCLPFKHSKGTHIHNSGLTQTENYGFLAQDSSCFKKDQSYAVVWFSRKERSLLLPRKIINPLNPMNDQHPISPFRNIAESFITFMRIKEMIADLRYFDC